MASFQENDNGTVRVQLEVRGLRASKTLPNMREARRWAVDKERELEASAAGDKGHGKTLRDAFRKFAEEVSPKRRGERWEIVRLTAYQKPGTPEDPGHGFPLDRPIGKITDDDIREWRDRRLKKNSRGAVLRDMALLSAVFEEARSEWKWIKTNPVREVKKPSKPAHRRRVITGPEVRNTLRMLGYQRGAPVRTVSQSVAIAFLVALATGMRAGELCGLRWEDMRQMYGTAHNVKARERGVSRDVPLSTVARKLIERMRGWDDDLVFGLSAQTLDALFRRARKRAGYTDFTFHDARHTAATRIALSGKWNVLELCKAFGWSNPKQAMTYFNPTAEDLAAKLG
jgi:integrase